MTLITDRTEIAGALRRIERGYREPNGTLGTSAHERFVRTAASATATTAQPTITLGLAKGWRFAAKDDMTVDLWAPPTSDGKATTYSFRNAALWRAIKIRGVSLT